MLRNYVKTALRTLRGRPGVTAINVAGLAVGLAACLLIGLWVQHELSYDDFHPNAEHTYRISFDGKLGDRSIEGPLTPAPMAETLTREFPEVTAGTRVGLPGNATVQVDTRSFSDVQVLSADSAFFSVLSGFTLRRGNPQTALTGTDAAVLTASAAQTYFGTKNPMGRVLRVGEDTCRVTGVMEAVPSASHLQFSVLTSQDLSPDVATQWAANNYYTYVHLANGASAEAFDRKLDRYVRAEIIPQLEETFEMPLDKMLTKGATYDYTPQRLTDIYLHANSQYEVGPTGSLATVYVFGAIALLIVVIACVNFMNLATARASERATEVGIRKAVGAGRFQLAGQFVGEAVLTTAAAFVLSLGLAYAARPLFTQLSGVPLSLGALLSGPVLLSLAAGVVVIGLVAGSYPAFFLSRFDPSVVLKVNEGHGSGGGPTWMRRGLVIGQFIISIAMIAGTLVVWQQYEYIRNKQLGFDEERIVVLERGQALGNSQNTFLERVRRQPGVATASFGSSLFGLVAQTGYVPAGAPSSESEGMSMIDVGPRFTETMGVSMAAGRPFDPGRAADSSAVMLNEAAVDVFGWTSREAVGRTIQRAGSDDVLQVIGVVDNFHYQSLRQRIKPLVLQLRETGNQEVYVRLESGSVQSALDDLRAAWQEAGGGPFQYAFLDQNFDRLHRSTQQTGRLLGVFAVLAILVACLGLFGLATYTVQRRTKEIGIRKALGATAPQVIGLISKEFAGLVGAAFVVAAPLAYVGAARWLNGFAYRTEVGIGTLLGAGSAVLVIALLTVSVHAFRAARTDPAMTLRDE